MEDVVSKHADSIEAANAGLVRAAGEISDKAASEMRAAISDFGRKLVEIAGSLDAAQAGVTQRLTALLNEAQASLTDLFIDNVTALNASANAMKAEMEARTRYLTTGVLPDREPSGEAKAESDPAPSDEPIKWPLPSKLLAVDPQESADGDAAPGERAGAALIHQEAAE